MTLPLATRLFCHARSLSGSPQGRRAATCSDNVTDVANKDEQSDGARLANAVESFICQSTIIPADGRGFRMAISSQSTSLAETFIGETPAAREASGFLQTPHSLCAGFQGRRWTPSWTASAPSRICSLTTQKMFQTSTSTTGRGRRTKSTSLEETFHFFLFPSLLRSRQVTASCDQGRSSVITVRCNPEKSDRGDLSVPR